MLRVRYDGNKYHPRAENGNTIFYQILHPYFYVSVLVILVLYSEETDSRESWNRISLWTLHVVDWPRLYNTIMHRFNLLLKIGTILGHSTETEYRLL